MAINKLTLIAGEIDTLNMLLGEVPMKWAAPITRFLNSKIVQFDPAPAEAPVDPEEKAT